MDAADPLRGYRDQFTIPLLPDTSEVTYLCGNSLGLQPRSVKDHIDAVLTAWGGLAVEGHFRGQRPWIHFHELLAEQTARVVGAKPSEVVVMNGLTVNLHLMMVSFYRPQGTRFRIAIESDAFPSDRYVMSSQLQFHGYDPAEGILELTPRPGEDTLRTEDIENLIDREGENIALVFMSGVNYRTGQAFAMDRITRAGHAKGCVVGFDLAHAVGNIPLKLHEWEVDFAAWCSYKYLNGGPGAIAGCFINERHAANPAIPLFSGWWGHNEEKRFQMGPVFERIPAAGGWQLSNSPILLLASLQASMDLFDRCGMQALRSKSVLLTGYLEYLVAHRCREKVRVITLPDAHQRGAQLSIVVGTDGRDIREELYTRGVVCDWREPNVLRLAPVPFYNSYRDVFHAVGTLASLL